MTEFRHTSHADQSQSPVSVRIIDGLTSGHTPRMLARQYDLPLDLVMMIIERARKRGEFESYELHTANCSKAACRPDPGSLVCAGCPLLPSRSSHRPRQHTVLRHVRQLLHNS